MRWFICTSLWINPENLTNHGKSWCKKKDVSITNEEIPPPKKKNMESIHDDVMDGLLFHE